MKTQFSEASVRYSAFGALVTPFVTAGVLSSDAVQIIDVLTQRWPATAPGAALGLAFVLEAQLRGHAGLEITKAKDVLVGRAVAAWVCARAALARGCSRRARELAGGRSALPDAAGR